MHTGVHIIPRSIIVRNHNKASTAIGLLHCHIISLAGKRISLSITKAKKDADTAVFKKYQAEQEAAEEVQE